MEDNSIKHPVILFIARHCVLNTVIFFLVCTAIFIKVVFFTEKEYTSSTTVIPNAANFSQGLSGQIGALAGLAGLNLSASSGQSQEMFRGILTSRRLLQEVLYDTFQNKSMDSGLKGRLIDFLDIKAKTSSDSLEKAIKIMHEKVIGVGIDIDNNILSLSVTLRDPFLSSVVANRMIEILDDLVQNQVQKEYHEQSIYLQQRLSDTENKMTISEDNLKCFLEKMRNYSEPKNQIEEMRLQRELELQTVIYTELQKQKETFILQNMINLSHIKVLDKAIPPYKKSRPKRLLMLISLGMLAFFCQIGANGCMVVYKKLQTDLTRNHFGIHY